MYGKDIDAVIKAVLNDSTNMLRHTAIEYIDTPFNTSDRVAEALSMYYTYNRDMPFRCRKIMDTLSIVERIKLAYFVKRAVYGRLDRGGVDSERKADVEQGNYKYIAWNDRIFIQVLATLPRGKKFIDIGCGIGMKPFLAWLVYGHEAAGVELNSHTYELGVYALDKFDINLIHDDAFDVSYEDYDILYMYRPIMMGENLLDLYKHVYDTMKDGAVLVEADGSGVRFNEMLPHASVRYWDNDSTTIITKGGD
jgi:SAM-dependent methyltransferase